MGAGEDGAGLGRIGGSRPARPERGLGRGLGRWLEIERINLIRATARRVERRASDAGGCLSVNGRRLLMDECSSAVGLVSAQVVARGTFVDATPLQVRAYVIKTASGLVITEHRQTCKVVPVDGEHFAATPEASGGDVGIWITASRDGQPAKPLVLALTALCRGESLSAIAAVVRRAGLEVSEGELVIELLRAIRYGKKGNRQLAGMLEALRPRLERPLVEHLVGLGLIDRRLLIVVVDQAFATADALTAKELDVSPERIRALRAEAKRRYGFVRNCFAATTALGWPLGPSATAC